MLASGIKVLVSHPYSYHYISALRIFIGVALIEFSQSINGKTLKIKTILSKLLEI